MEFSESQINVLRELPASRKTVEEALDISEDAVKGRIKRIRNQAGKDAIQYINGNYVWDGEEPIHRITSRNKGQVTKEANRHLRRLESEEKHKLAKLQPATTPLRIPETDEDIVIHRSDSHIGQVVRDDRGRKIFDVETCLRREREINDEVIKLAKVAREYKQVNTCHLLLGGDTVTNENIYDEQPHDIELTLDKQIDLGADLFLNHIKKLAEVFDAVQVVCQGGNHGEIRASGMSGKANADDICYSRIDRLVRENSGLDNVQLVRNDSTTGINFTMRGHNAHLRHGQDSLPHIGTPTAKERWKSWWYKNRFDIAYRGHFHHFRLEEVFDKPVIMSGAVCPPDDYEDSLGIAGQKPGAIIHGVTDDDVFPWFRRITFESV